MGNAKSQEQGSVNVKTVQRRPTRVTSAADIVTHHPLSAEIRFHLVHGQNISIQHDRKVAERTTGFCDAIVFSSRAVQLMEKITIILSSIDDGWSGALRLGITTVSPSSIYDLPKYACPDLTNRSGFWAKALPVDVCKLNNEVTFYVDIAGRFMYSVNGDREKKLFDGIDVSRDLFVLFDLYGNTKSLTITQPIEDDHHSLLHRYRTDTNLHMPLPPDMGSCAKENLGLNEKPAPLSFSATMGSGLKCRNRIHITRKEHCIDSSCIAFTSERISAGQTVYFYCAGCQLESLHGLLQELSFGIGITTCKPTSLVVNELPQDSMMLMDRPEYWVFFRDFENPKFGEYFSISVEKDGTITYQRQNKEKVILFYADVYEPLYLFVDLCGPVSSLGLAGISARHAIIERSAEDPTATLNLYTTVEEGQREDVPSTSRYPHDLPSIHGASGNTVFSDISTVLAGSSYPHDEYVPYAPIPIDDEDTSDDEFVEALDHRVAHHDAIDTTVSLPQIESDLTPNIDELRTSIDELWRRIMPEPLPKPKHLPASKKSASISENQTTDNKPSTSSVDGNAPESNKIAECVICCDVTANSVMYPCGHACLCFECGQVILKQVKRICPLCRAQVKDVIRIYQS